MSRECMFLGSLSRHNKDLERRTLKPPRHVTALGSWTNRVIALRQISVTAVFYLEDTRRIHPRSVLACQPKEKRLEKRVGEGEREKEGRQVGEREKALWLLLLCFFLGLGLPYANWV